MRSSTPTMEARKCDSSITGRGRMRPAASSGPASVGVVAEISMKAPARKAISENSVGAKSSVTSCAAAAAPLICAPA